MATRTNLQTASNYAWSTLDEIKHIDKLGHTHQGEVTDYLKGYLKALSNRVNFANIDKALVKQYAEKALRKEIQKQALIKSGILV